MYCHSPDGNTAAALEDKAFNIIYHQKTQLLLWRSLHCVISIIITPQPHYNVHHYSANFGIAMAPKSLHTIHH